MAIPTFNLARALAARETVFSGWCSLPYPIVAETIGREGFAAVTLEAQHGLWDVNGLLTGVAAVRQSGAAPVVRVKALGTSSRSAPFFASARYSSGKRRS